MVQRQADPDLETPHEVISRMNRAANGDKIQEIFTGNWESYYSTEYMALRGASFYLAWWTQYTLELALGVFERSAFSDEWEEVFRWEFEAAVEELDGDMYDPNYYRSSTDQEDDDNETEPELTAAPDANTGSNQPESTISASRPPAFGKEIRTDRGSERISGRNPFADPSRLKEAGLHQGGN